MTDSAPTPSSVLIIGSGVFGLSTAWALTQRPTFAHTSITVVDRAPGGVFPARDAASIDTSRIVRADYADPAYTALATEALAEWRRRGPDSIGGEGRYRENGLILTADEGEGEGEGGRPVKGGKKTAMSYVRESWENVLAVATASDPMLAGRIHELPGKNAIQQRYGTGGGSGSWGYINESSGWADADASMKWFYDRVAATGRVHYVGGTVESLEHDADTVTGAKLTTGEVLTADLVVLAAGAWTGSLIDLAGRTTATGQILAYIDLSPEEQKQLENIPTLLNLSTGLFVIPPVNQVLKVARHSYGYLNPVTGKRPPLGSPEGRVSKISLPFTQLDDPGLSIPTEGIQALRQALREMLPQGNFQHRPFSKQRLCWYHDTSTGDFLIDHHPHWKRLFVATGGSGHAFKFLPILGEKIVDCVTGAYPPNFRDKWTWAAFSGTPIVIATEDGSRGGKPGLILYNELGRG